MIDYCLIMGLQTPTLAVVFVLQGNVVTQ